MRKAILFLLSLSATVACNRDNEALPLDKPSIRRVFCDHEPDVEHSREEYSYSNDLLDETQHYINDTLVSSVLYQYDAAGNLEEVTKTDHQRDELSITVFKNNGFGKPDREIDTDYKRDSTGNWQIDGEYETLYEYENALLVKETASWGGVKTYEYDDGNMVKRIDHRKGGDQHHIYHYEYKDDKLVKEIKETSDGREIYVKRYDYDSRDRLITIHEDGDLVEKNVYRRGRLTRKNQWYHGMDPGYYACCCYLNYEIHYEY